MLLAATIDHLEQATPRAVLIGLSLGAPFRFAAGQAVLVGVPGAERRPYSIAVGPSEAARTGRLQLLVGLGEEGTPGPHLPGLAPGLVVDIEGPLGTFQYPQVVAEPAVLFVAGGSGIAPLRAMLHEALEASPTPRLRVLHSARSGAEFAFGDELSRLARDGRIQYWRTATREAEAAWQGGRGRISRAELEAVVDTPETLCFVCGPTALVHEVPRMLEDIGVPASRIRVEEWAVARGPTA